MPYVELLDSSKALKIGLPASISIVFVKELEGTYKSNIVDLDTKKRIVFFSIPSIKGRFVPIPKGVRMTVNLFDKSSIYEFETVSLGVVKMENMYVIPAPYPEVVRKTERRRFVRIPLYLEGRLYTSPESDSESFSFATRNISAGGLLIVTKKYLNEGDTVYIDLKLDEDLILQKQKCRIARKDEPTEDGYTYGVQFINLPVGIETKLVRFIFQKELKMKNIR